jgi:hypothetical protein
MLSFQCFGSLLEATRSHQKIKTLQSQMQSKIGLAAPWFSFTEQLDKAKSDPVRSSKIGLDPQSPGRYPDPERLAAIYPSVLFILLRTNPLN